MAEYTLFHRKRGRFVRATLIVVALLVLPATQQWLPAQDAEQLESLFAAKAVSRAELAALLAAAGVTVDTRSDDGAAGADVAATDARTIDELADVMVQLDGPAPSLGYRMLPGPRYAVRMLRRSESFPRDPLALPAGSVPDGRTVLQLLREPLSSAANDPGASPTVVLRERVAPTRPAGPWFEWDLEQRLNSATTDGEDYSGSAGTRLDTRLSVGRVVDAEARVDFDVSDSEDPQVRLLDGSVSLVISRADALRDMRVAGGRLSSGALRQDGLALEARGPLGESLVAVGYRGLLPAELDGLSALPIEADDSFSAVAQVTALELLGRQNPGVAVQSVVDPERSFHLTQIQLDISGPLAPRLFYDAQGAYQTGDGGEALDRSFGGWTVGGSLRWFPQSRTPLRLTAELAAASGGEAGEGSIGSAGGSGVFRGYIPLSDVTPWSLYGGSFTNVGVARTAVDLRPLERVIARLDALYLLQLTDGATGDAATDADPSSGPALGMEIGGEIEFELVPDLILDLNSRIFLPADGSRDSVWRVGLGLLARL